MFNCNYVTPWPLFEGILTTKFTFHILLCWHNAGIMLPALIEQCWHNVPVPNYISICGCAWAQYFITDLLFQFNFITRRWELRYGDYHFLLDTYQGRYQLVVLYFSVGKTLILHIHICELIVEFLFDGWTQNRQTTK